MSIRSIAALVFGGLLSTALHAGMPGASFAYQGVLKNAQQKPLTGNQTVTICLYGTATGSSILWGRQFNALLDSNGLFNLEVADGDSNVSGAKYTELAKALRDASTTSFYVGLTVNGSSGEIRPRQQLLAVPFATVAGDVANASGNMTVSNLLDAKTVKTGALTATDSATIQKTLTVNSTAQIGGKLTVASGGAKISGAIELNGATTIGSTLTVKGATTLSEKLTAEKETTVKNNLIVTGDIYKKVGDAQHQISFVKGMIMLWSGSKDNVPAGWKLCDGNNGTPDLRDRFVVGAGNSYSVGNTGGANEVKLTTSQIPSHYHTYVSDDEISDVATKDSTTTLSINWDNGSGNNGKYYRTSSAGGGSSHENRPPYYALCYIMYVGA